jgi:cell division protein FtsZ
LQAAEKAIANPLLDEISLRGAKGVLINITGGYDMTLFELDEAANRIREEVDPDANIIVGSTMDPTLDGMMRVSVVATGIDAAPATAEVPVPRRRLSEPLQPAEQHYAPAPEAPRQPALTVNVQPAPAPQQPVQQPVQQRAPQQPVHQQPAQHQPVQQERNLFNASDDSDLPPAAYRPQPSAQHAPRDLYVEEDAAAFVAPRPRSPGSPSPEALARLQAAVSKAPATPAQQRPAGQPMAAQRQPAAPQARPAAEKPRFGINSLINRMTGQGDGHAQGASHAAAARPQAPQHAAYDDEPETDPDQDRIEIPAFLRRQAN